MPMPYDLTGGLLGTGSGLMTGNTGAAGGQDPNAAAAEAQALDQPSTGFVMNAPPMVQEPDMGEALRSVAQGIAASNQAGQGLAGWLAAGLGNYSKNLEDQRRRSYEQRRQSLTDMALLGEIQQRQMATQAMTNKVRALQRLKTMNPALADQIDIDPEGVSAAMTAALVPKYEKIGLGDKIIKMQDGKATVVADPMADAMTGGAGAGGAGQGDATAAAGADQYVPKDPADPNGVFDTQSPKYNGIPAGYRATVKEMLSGNVTGRLLSNPTVGPLLEAWAQQVDPSFDRTQMATRQKTAEDYASDGTSGQLITAAGAAAQHVADAKMAFDKMHNGSFTPLNWIKNEKASLSDNDRHTAMNEFDTAIGNYAPEMAKIATGSSSPAVSEINAKKEPFSHNNGPEAMAGSLQESASLIKGKLKEMIYTYRRNMGGRLPPGLPVFSPETIQSFKDLGVDLTDILPAASKASAASGQASPPAGYSPQSPVVDQIAKTIDAMTPKAGQAAAASAITAPGAPGLKLPAGSPVPPVQGAKLAPDGKWYLPDPSRPGKFLMVQ